ncbi:MarR family winged helix-turn-helix transcriptional regulator [Streptomyces sp. NPDC001508]|uniref:MarR family winged helix-turn-helix transcriptional regulator n=1 Tax=Streptomyces sp. NPDC001508 TaxID=3154656 RepID=UPI0033224A97
MEQRGATATASTPEQVGLSFLHLAYALREQVDQHMTATAGLSLSRTKVLQVLAGRGALHQAELATALGQAPRSVTQIVEGLERLGLVSRTGHPEDRRRKTVELTPAGRTALAPAEEAGTRVLRQRFGSLTPQQLTDLDALLTLVGSTPAGDDAG